MSTDHGSLKLILNITDTACWFAQRHLRLSIYDFVLVHRVGVKHQVADTLSRLQTTGEDPTYFDDELPVLAIDEQQSGKQDVHIISIRVNQDILLRPTEQQTLDAPFTQKKLMLEKNTTTIVKRLSYK